MIVGEGFGAVCQSIINELKRVSIRKFKSYQGLLFIYEEATTVKNDQISSMHAILFITTPRIVCRISIITRYFL